MEWNRVSEIGYDYSTGRVCKLQSKMSDYVSCRRYHDDDDAKQRSDRRLEKDAEVKWNSVAAFA